ncbi:hypothetical protein NHX12_017448, partial [Muraenolepis orangiensis]
AAVRNTDGECVSGRWCEEKRRGGEEEKRRRGEEEERRERRGEEEKRRRAPLRWTAASGSEGALNAPVKDPAHHVVVLDTNTSPPSQSGEEQ